MHLIEIFLPLRDNDGSPFAAGNYADIRKTLTEKFGGLTAFSRAPADGTDKEGGRERHDELVVLSHDRRAGTWLVVSLPKGTRTQVQAGPHTHRMSDVTLL